MGVTTGVAVRNFRDPTTGSREAIKCARSGLGFQAKCGIFGS